jgi:hypothetical protein
MGKPPVIPNKPVPPIVNKPTVKGDADPVVEVNQKSSPLKINNPFIINKGAAKSESKETVKEETKVGQTEEIKTEENPHALAQNAEAENKVETPVEEVKTVEQPKEEHKTNKRTSKKKNTAKAPDAEVVSDKAEIITENTLVIPKTQIEFDEAINSIRSGFVDSEWETFRNETSTRFNEIVISNDMTTTAIKSTLAELSSMKDSIWLEFNDTKTMFENLTAKEPEGIIERIKKISSKGSNPEERKLNATYAVMNYKDENGNVVNLYELLDEMRDRFNFLKSLMDGIAYKNSVLITMLGSLKLEK